MIIQYVFRDLMCAILAALLGIVMLSNQNPITTQENIKPPGNIIVTITWPEGNDDMDLWLMGPGEKKPVGFLNKDGDIWNLLRDDLGIGNDDTGLNYENAFSRGTPEGEYIVNVLAFNVTTGFPKEVRYEVRINQSNGNTIKVDSGTITFNHQKEELTAISFRLDKDGHLVEGSVLKIYNPLVYKDKPQP